MSTPMFEQFHRLKAAHPTALLFFRMGDFYELFFEDAEVAAKELDLTLTSRNKKDPSPIPMAGVPHHAAGAYIQRLISAGYRVAIAEQVEDPKLAKGLVKREVVRVVTPGVVLDTDALAKRAPNYLCCVARAGEHWGIAALDCSTGVLKATDVRSADAAGAELARLEPQELILCPQIKPELVKRWIKGVLLSPAPKAGFTSCKGIRGAEDLSPATHRAVAGAVAYGREVSGGELHNLQPVEVYGTTGLMVLDPTTRRNLELVRTLRTNQRKGSLLHLLDRTTTAMGGRALRHWLNFPLLDVSQITERQAGVYAFVEDQDLREHIRDTLRPVSDVERIAARVAQGTAHARDLASLATALEATPSLVEACRGSRALQRHLPQDQVQDVAQDIRRWLVPDPPTTLTEGGLIPAGVHEELDTLVRLSLDGVSVLSDLEQRERELSGIKTLRLRKNKVFGYFLEVTRAHLHKVPDRWLRKQTLTNAERYITPELKELEDQVLGADERRKVLELELFAQLRSRVGEHVRRLQGLARKIAALDALAGLAEVAVEHSWVSPTLDLSQELDIRSGRHPVVEASLEDERFVPNDLFMDNAAQFIVLTGPNMAGKSTIMRQTALCVLLAQIGSYVPAKSARIGIVDRIFTRVGASDDLGAGQSTFMVEMAETATILHHATERSLVLLDEIGRGTSTYDGLSIAWAVAEDLSTRTKCRTLFATHYHELCDLAETRDNVVNFSVAVSVLGDEIIFLRRLKSGGASRSYGIQCARLAGLPAPVVERAKSLLRRFEKNGPRNDRDQLSLFGSVSAHPSASAEDEAPAHHPVVDALDAIDPDELSPRAAQAALYRLKSISENRHG